MDAKAISPRWYCLDRDGVAMLCKDEADAIAQVAENDECWPCRAPHRAVLLCDAAEIDRWKALYRSAINEANGLTNYVDDRPELRSAERRIAAIEADARTGGNG